MGLRSMAVPSTQGGWPPVLWIFGPGMLAGFLLVRFKPRLLIAPAVLAVLWIAYVLCMAWVFNQMSMPGQGGTS